jgi:hypothetical protein
MTDRVKGLVVALDKDYRIDDVQAIIEAIKMTKGVAAVTPSITTPEDWMNRSHVLLKVQKDLFGFAKNLGSPDGPLVD